MTKRYNLKNIRALLTEGFTAEELRRFCYDEPDFRPVYNRLSESTGKATIVDLLVEYANQKIRLEALLTWAKEHNPALYEKHQPYDETGSSDPSNDGDTRPERKTNFIPLFLSLLAISAILGAIYMFRPPVNYGAAQTATVPAAITPATLDTTTVSSPAPLPEWEVFVEPTTARHFVGAEHDVYVTVRDLNGALIVSETVYLQIVEGPHQGVTQQLQTNNDGQVAFRYIGSAKGLDIIHVWAGAEQYESLPATMKAEITIDWQ
jgi:hypothetical protein